MSKPQDKDVKVQEVDDDEDDELPPNLLANNEADKIDEAALRAAAAGGAAAGKSSKRYAKAMAKLGLKPEGGIFRVQIRKQRGTSFGISKPEVYRFPNTNTFVIFGETQMEEGGEAQRAAATVTGATAAPAAKPGDANSTAAAAPASTADDKDDDNVDAGDLGEKEIKLVMSQANVSRGKAIKALKNNKGDIVNTIMELTM